MSSKPKPNKSRAKTKVVENLVKHMLLVGALPPVPSLPQQRRTLVPAWVITDKRRPYPSLGSPTMFHPLTQHLGAVSTSPHMPIFRGQSGHMLVQYLGTCRIHLRGACLRLDLIDFDCQRPSF